MDTFSIGSLRLDRIDELCGPAVDPWTLLPSLPADAVERNVDWFAPVFYDTAAAALILVLGGKQKAAQRLTGLCALGFLVGAGIAFYHVGVEQQWWPGTGACVGTAADSAQTIEELRAQLLTAPVVRCDDVGWSLFGISMAGYNGIFSLALAVATLSGLRRMREEEPS